MNSSALGVNYVTPLDNKSTLKLSPMSRSPLILYLGRENPF
jgi:hypothetical protein